jgi:hypothetical protein
MEMSLSGFFSCEYFVFLYRLSVLLYKSLAYQNAELVYHVLTYIFLNSFGLSSYVPS